MDFQLPVGTRGPLVHAEESEAAVAHRVSAHHNASLAVVLYLQTQIVRALLPGGG